MVRLVLRNALWCCLLRYVQGLYGVQWGSIKKNKTKQTQSWKPRLGNESLRQMLTQIRVEGPNKENLGYILQSLQAFLMMREEITYSVIGNWTKKKKVSIYSSAAAVLLLLHLWLSKKHWKTPPRAVNGAFLWVYWVFAGPDLGSCFHCRLGGWFHPAFPHAQTL